KGRIGASHFDVEDIRVAHQLATQHRYRNSNGRQPRRFGQIEAVAGIGENIVRVEQLDFPTIRVVKGISIVVERVDGVGDEYTRGRGWSGGQFLAEERPFLPRFDQIVDAQVPAQ